MLEENARVIEVQDGYAWVETQRRSSCGSCDARSGCGTGALSRVLGNRPLRVRALNQIGAESGEQVVVGLADDALVRASLAVYLVPLLTLLGGGLLAEALTVQVGAGEAMTFAGGLIGLLLGFAWVRWFGLRVRDDARFQAVILRRAGAAAQPVTLQFQK